DVVDGAVFEYRELLHQRLHGRLQLAVAGQTVAQGISGVVADVSYFSSLDGETVGGAPGHRLASVVLVLPTGDFIGTWWNLVHEVFAQNETAVDVFVVAEGPEL